MPSLTLNGYKYPLLTDKALLYLFTLPFVSTSYEDTQ
jgi:hypothetical protein